MGTAWGQHRDSRVFGGAEAERSGWRARGTEAGGDSEQSRREHRAGPGQPVLTRRASGEVGAEDRERERSQRGGGPALEAEMGRVTPGRGGRARAGGERRQRGRGRQRYGQAAWAGRYGSAELLRVGRARHARPAGWDAARKAAQDAARVARGTAWRSGRTTGQPAQRTWHVPCTRWCTAQGRMVHGPVCTTGRAVRGTGQDGARRSTHHGQDGA